MKLRYNKTYFVYYAILIFVLFCSTFYIYDFYHFYYKVDLSVADFLIFQMQNNTYFFMIIPIVIILIQKHTVEMFYENAIIRLKSRTELWNIQLLTNLLICLFSSFVFVVFVSLFSLIVCQDFVNWSQDISVVRKIYAMDLSVFHSFFQIILIVFIINFVNLFFISSLYQTLYLCIKNKVLIWIIIFSIIVFSLYFNINIFVRTLSHILFLDFDIHIFCIQILSIIGLLFMSFHFTKRKEFL